MPWQSVDDTAHFQPPAIPQPLRPIPRPIFPLYNVVMDAMKTLLPALDPLNIAERKAKIAQAQLEMSPQMRALREAQVDTQRSQLALTKFQNEWMLQHRVPPNMSKGGIPWYIQQDLNEQAKNAPTDKTLGQPPGQGGGQQPTTNRSQIEYGQPEDVHQGPVDTNVPVEHNAPAAPEVPAQGQDQAPQQAPGDNVPSMPVQQAAAPSDFNPNPGQAWATAGGDLNLSPNQLGRDEEDAFAPEVMES